MTNTGTSNAGMSNAGMSNAGTSNAGMSSTGSQQLKVNLRQQKRAQMKAQVSQDRTQQSVDQSRKVSMDYASVDSSNFNKMSQMQGGGALASNHYVGQQANQVNTSHSN